MGVLGFLAKQLALNLIPVQWDLLVISGVAKVRPAGQKPQICTDFDDFSNKFDQISAYFPLNLVLKPLHSVLSQFASVY